MVPTVREERRKFLIMSVSILRITSEKRSPATSFTPSPKAASTSELPPGRVTERLNIFDRYAHLVRACALPLDDDETQVLLNVLMAPLWNPPLLNILLRKFRDSDDYLKGIPAAESLYEKVPVSDLSTTAGHRPRAQLDR